MSEADDSAVSGRSRRSPLLGSRDVQRGASFAVGVALVALMVLVLWHAAPVLLIAFGGITVALALRGAAERIAAVTRVPVGVAVVLVALTAVATAGLLAWGLADDVGGQVRALAERLPQAVNRLRQHLAEHPWGQLLLASIPRTVPDFRALTGGDLTSVLGASFGVVAYVGVAAFVAVYVALDPGVYRRGLLAVVPGRNRRRTEQMLNAVGLTLRRWIVGRLVAMLAIGALTALGLWIIGVPVALTLGLLAGILNFVPYIGPLVSFVPAGLIALLQGYHDVLWVAALYVVVQTVESYLLTPLVQQRAVLLPPALTITAQVILGLIFGGVGLLFATPLTAALVVVIQLLYVEDLLHENANVRGATADHAAA